MTEARIQSVAKALPRYQRSTKDILPYVESWLGDTDDRFRRKVVKIFEGAGVDRRFGIMDIDDVFEPTGFAERNKVYEREAKALGSRALRDALKKTGWSPDSLDIVITVSCTGIMIPSLDAFLIDSVGLRNDVLRLPVTEMGCAAGVSGLIYADHFLRSMPGRRAVVVAVESPTATFQWSDFSMANMVSAALFGDGAACVLLSSEAEAEGPRIKGHGMYHFPDSTHLMGFDWAQTGLKMVLDPAVPETIEAHFPDIVHPFLKSLDTDIGKVDHLIFHPGGRKIVQTVESLFGSLGKNIDDTRAVLRDYGNMSSVTVLYVLERFLERSLSEGEQGMILSFGPGFSAQRVLVEW